MAYPQEVLFVSMDYFQKLTPVNGAVDVNVIKPCMYVAQDKYLAPYLGDSLYSALKTKISGGTLSGNYETLVNDYCAKVVVYWTLVELMPKMMYKYNNGTIGQHNSEDYTPISDTAMKDELERAKKNAEFYTQRLVDYLCYNSSLFVEYSNNTGAQRSPKTKAYNTSIMFSDQANGVGRKVQIHPRYLP